MSFFAFYIDGTIRAFPVPGKMIGDVIRDAKQLSAQHCGTAVEFNLNGVQMLIDSETSESNAYWSYMRSLDEEVT